MITARRLGAAVSEGAGMTMVVTTTRDDRRSLPDHHQSIAVLGGRRVLVDTPLVPLIEVLHRRGIETLFSCRDVLPPSGTWRDDPDATRFYVVLRDVEELRRLIGLLSPCAELCRSIYPCVGITRWEYALSIQGGPGDPGRPDTALRLQCAVFIPIEQLDSLVDALTSEASAH